MLGTLVSQTMLNIVALAVLGSVMFSSVDLFNGHQDALLIAAIAPVALLVIVLLLPLLLRLGPGGSRFARAHAAVAQVRKALTGLKNPPQLAKSPLLSLALVERRVARAGQEDNRLNRVVALRELLIEQIEGLRPDSDGSAHRVGDAWRFYNVLYYPYVRELSRKSALAEVRRLGEERRRNGQREPGELEQVLAWLADVDEDTFYKWQRRASDTIATILWEENYKIAQDSA